MIRLKKVHELSHSKGTPHMKFRIHAVADRRSVWRDILSQIIPPRRLRLGVAAIAAVPESGSQTEGAVGGEEGGGRWGGRLLMARGRGARAALALALATALAALAGGAGLRVPRQGRPPSHWGGKVAKPPRRLKGKQLPHRRSWRRHHGHRDETPLVGWQGERGRYGRNEPRGGHGTGAEVEGDPRAWPIGAHRAESRAQREGDPEGRWGGSRGGKNPKWHGLGDPLQRSLPAGVLVRQVSEFPQVYVAEGLLEPEECDHLIALAEPRLMRNTIVDTRGGVGERARAVELDKLSKARTSHGAFLDRRADTVVAAVEAKVMRFAGFPEVHGEPMQVLRYTHGQEYVPHTDTFPKNYMKLADGMQRSATALIYLSDVESGGETAFPVSRWLHPKEAWADGDYTACGRLGVSVKPKKGSVLLFYNLDLGGKPSKFSQHTGCPVSSGTKWTATKWIHELPFRGLRFPNSDPE